MINSGYKPLLKSSLRDAARMIQWTQISGGIQAPTDLMGEKANLQLRIRNDVLVFNCLKHTKLQPYPQQDSPDKVSHESSCHSPMIQ